MPETVAIILHWNTDYAEIPRVELPNVVAKSYQPIVDAFEGFEGTVCFNITGHTIDYLVKHHPELVDQLKALVTVGVVEMVACGYSHPILPLLPLPRIRAQLEGHVKRVEEVFGKRPKGVWPPELAVSPLILAEFDRLGLEWTTLDHEHVELAQTLGNDVNLFERRDKTVTEVLADAFWAEGRLDTLSQYRKAMKTMEAWNERLTSPLERVMISGDRTMKGFLSSQSWWNGTKIALSNSVSLYKAEKHLKTVLSSQAKHLPLYTSDVEFFGYRELGGKVPSPASLVSFLSTLKRHGVKTVSPSQIPTDEWPEEPKFVGTGSWYSDKSFRVWTDSEDNREYTRRLAEVYDFLCRKDWDSKLMAEVEPWLRIAENSDPRGWAPLPERKHEAYSAIMTMYDHLGLF